MTSTNGRNVRVNSNSVRFEKANIALTVLSLWGKVARGISLARKAGLEWRCERYPEGNPTKAQCSEPSETVHASTVKKRNKKKTDGWEAWDGRAQRRKEYRRLFCECLLIFLEEFLASTKWEGLCLMRTFLRQKGLERYRFQKRWWPSGVWPKTSTALWAPEQHNVCDGPWYHLSSQIGACGPW